MKDVNNIAIIATMRLRGTWKILPSNLRLDPQMRANPSNKSCAFDDSETGELIIEMLPELTQGASKLLLHSMNRLEVQIASSPYRAIFLPANSGAIVIDASEFEGANPAAKSAKRLAKSAAEKECLVMMGQPFRNRIATGGLRCRPSEEDRSYGDGQAAVWSMRSLAAGRAVAAIQCGDAISGSDGIAQSWRTFAKRLCRRIEE